MNGKGVGSRADLSYRRSVPEPRGRARQGARRPSRHQGHQERSSHSRLFRGRRAIRQRLARFASGRARRTSPSGDAGTIPAIGAIGSLRAQNRDDVKVYGVNGNAQALENIKKGFMTATAWQDSYTEGHNMITLLPEIVKAGASWTAESGRGARGSGDQGQHRQIPGGSSFRPEMIAGQRAA